MSVPEQVIRFVNPRFPLPWDRTGIADAAENRRVWTMPAEG